MIPVPFGAAAVGGFCARIGVNAAKSELRTRSLRTPTFTTRLFLKNVLEVLAAAESRCRWLARGVVPTKPTGFMYCVTWKGSPLGVVKFMMPMISPNCAMFGTAYAWGSLVLPIGGR